MENNTILKTKLEEINRIKEEHNKISKLISSGKATNNEFKKFSRIDNIFRLIEKLETYQKQLNENNEIIKQSSDHELISLAKEDSKVLGQEISKLDEEIFLLLNPSNEDKFHSVIMEIRAGAGGDEASLFAADLQRMYTLYAQRQNWKVSIYDLHENESGGIKTVILHIEGEDAYKKLIRESGVHRVQRIPVTESSGRIHTSTATVAVLPELEDIEIEIKPNDIEVETMHSSGPGGQCVNTTDSAVRMTHKPTGIVVTCRESKSQLQNRERAMQMLQAKLYQAEKEKQENQLKNQRSDQIGTGDRAEKIRTYNFQQDRITDHRLKYSWHNIPKIMDGFLEDIVEKTSIIKI